MIPQNQSKTRKNHKIRAFFLAALMLVLQVPVLASADAASATATSTTTTSPTLEEKPSFSTWAIPELNEAEKYGLYTVEWYRQGFKKTIKPARLQELMVNLKAKLQETGVTPQGSAPALVASANPTRLEVINSIFNEMGQYDATLLVQKLDVASIMTKCGVVKGEKGQLFLDRPCTTEEAVLMSARAIQYLNEQFKSGARGLVWKATKGQTTVYMLGSIHLANTEIYPFDARLVEAYESADALYVEANVLNPTNGYNDFIKAATLPEGKVLKDVVDAKSYARILEVCKLYGIPEENLKSFKPWMVALSLSNIVTTATSSIEESNKSASLGIDMYFLTRALMNGMPVVELEGLAFQGQLFDGLTDDYEVKYLNSTVDQVLALASTDPNNAEAKAIKEEAIKNQESFKNWLKLWEKGDKEAFKRDVNTAMAGGDSDEIAALLLGKRDQAMAEKIGALLDKGEDKTYFVVVGAAHLATDKMVIDILKAKGYTVEDFYK